MDKTQKARLWCCDHV